MSATLWNETTVCTGGQVGTSLNFIFLIRTLRVGRSGPKGSAPLNIASRSRPPGFLLYAGFTIHLDVSNSGGISERGREAA